MMQALGWIFLFLAMFILLVGFITLAPSLFSFQPFDHRKVARRTVVMGSIGLGCAGIGMILHSYQEWMSPFTVESFVQILTFVVALAVFAVLQGLFMFWYLRSLSATYAQREERIAEQKRQRESEHAGDAPTEA